MALSTIKTVHLRGMTDNAGNPNAEIKTVKVERSGFDTYSFLLDSSLAGGTILFAVNPTAEDTITLNTQAWTFKSSGASGTQSNITKDFGSIEFAKVPTAEDTITLKGVTWTFKASGASGAETDLTKDFGSIEFSTQPTAEDTITLGGVTWTFKSSGASGNETDIGAALSNTLTALVSDLQGSGDGGITPATYTETGSDTLVITHDTTGDQSAYVITVSGLTGAPTSFTAALGGGLAGTLTSLVSDLQGSGDTDIDDATYTESGGNKLIVTHDTTGDQSAYVITVSGLTVAATAFTAALGGGLAASLTQLVSDLQGSGDADIDDATYTESGSNTLIITHDTKGAAGNAYALAASITGGATLSGSILNGGDDGKTHSFRLGTTQMSRLFNFIFGISDTVGAE